jgi:uncharacterized protein (DUF2147 family)
MLGTITHQLTTNTRKLLTWVLCFSVLAGLLSFQTTQDNPDAILGDWKTGAGNAIVRIYKNGQKYQGKIVWLKEPLDVETGKPKVDKNHPDASNRNRPLLGLINVWGFQFVEKNNWKDGHIYDPKNGKTYACKIKMVNNSTIEVRGYIGISMIGRTDTWSRQEAK